MILGFCLIIYGGPLALMITVIDLILQIAIELNFELNFSLFLVADIAGASEMLRRDHFNWISSVSHSWFTMVP